MWIRFNAVERDVLRNFFNSYRINPFHPFYGFIGNYGAIATANDLALTARLRRRELCGEVFSDHMCPARLMLLAPRGAGKTDYLRRFAQLLLTPLAEVDGANLRSLEEIVVACQKAWANSEAAASQFLPPIEATDTPTGRLMVIPPMTLFIDEVHRLSDANQDRLLKMADNDKDGFLVLGDLRIDFRQVAVVIATNTPDKLKPAFKSRFLPVELDALTPEIIAKIVQGRFPHWSPEACQQVAILVPVTRMALAFADSVETALVNMDDGTSLLTAIDEVRRRRKIYRNGLTKRALQILRILANSPAGLSRKMLLASAEDMGENELEKEVLPLLVATQGRKARISTSPKHLITPAGRAAIEECEEEDYVVC